MKEVSISFDQVQRKAVSYIFPIIVIMATPFFLIHGFDVYQAFINYIHSLIEHSYTLLFLLVFILKIFIVGFIGIAIHELLHGLFWGIFAKDQFKAIEFGFNHEWLTPYTHCISPLKIKHYFIGAIAPLFFLGMLPFIISLFTGSLSLWFFGLFFTIAASGDIIAIQCLKGIPKETFVQDHDEKIGFYVLEDDGSE